jgi:hypothetical protein
VNPQKSIILQREETLIMKRKLALFMVLALIVSLIPANVFAGSSNSMVTVPTITDSETYDPDDSDVPFLRIEEGNAGEFKTTSQTFTLTLSNGDWDDQTEATFESLMETEILANSNSGAVAVDATLTVDVERVSDSRIDITFFVSDTTDDELWFKVPIAFDADDEGDVEVTLDERNTSLTGGTYTVARVSGGDTVVDIDGTTDFSDEAAMEQILIEEVVMGTFEDGDQIKLKITDSDFDWRDDISGATFALEGAGEFSYMTFTEETVEANLGDGEYFIDGNLMIIQLDISAGLDDTGSIIITNLGIEADDADYGEVKVKFYGDNVTEETLTIGNYTDYEVTVEGDDDDDMVTIYSGKIGDDIAVDGSDDGSSSTNQGYEEIAEFNNAYNGDETTELTGADHNEEAANELVTLVLKETVANSWLSNRTTEIEFPEWVKIIDVEVESDTDNVSEAGLQTELDSEIQDSFGNSVDFSIDKTDDDDTTEIWLTFYVSVEADATGDIVATVGGSALEDDYEVKLGEAVAPIEVEIETKDVRIGLQDQEVGTITITEAAAEVLESGRYIVLTLEDEIEFASTPTVEVIEGDLTIDDVEKSGSTIEIKIDDESTEASTIQITGLEVDVDRTVEEGPFDIDIQGNAIVMNYNDDGDDFRFDTSSVVSTAFVNVITPADADVKAAETVSFTIDAMEYKIGDTVVTMDVAPYIDSANRTMLPLRAFANALGVADSDILWNGTERSVTIFKGDAVVKVVIGEMAFMKNGVSVPMDTTAVIKDGRTFLPVRALGQALGAEIGWDAATRTVTID